MRREKDSLGELDVPDEAYYGIQTVRCASNYQVSDHTYNEYPEVIRAMAEIKKACAMTNAQIGALDSDKAKAICEAADEMIAGKFSGQFPVVIWRSQGTGINMNVNEVLANRANEILTGHRGYDAVHPNSHVNMCQSSNDVFPTAEVIVFRRLLNPLIQAAVKVEKALESKAVEFKYVTRLGRTGFQDAVPMTWGQVFGGWQSSVQRTRIALERIHSTMNEGVLGGTAVGTGMGQLPGYAEHIYENLSKVLGFEMHLVQMHWEAIPDSGVFDAMRNTDRDFIMMDAVKALVSSSARIAHDMTVFSSGPRSGIGEISLEPTGKEIFGYPKESTPYVCEMLLDVMGEVYAASRMMYFAATEGQLDHGSQNSAGFITAIDAIKVATKALEIFARDVVSLVKVNPDVCSRNAELSTSLSTMVGSLFGYPIGVRVAKTAIRDAITCKEAALKEELLSPEVCEEIFDINKLTDRRAMLELFRKYKNLRKIS